MKENDSLSSRIPILSPSVSILNKLRLTPAAMPSSLLPQDRARVPPGSPLATPPKRLLLAEAESPAKRGRLNAYGVPAAMQPTARKALGTRIQVCVRKKPLMHDADVCDILQEGSALVIHETRTKLDGITKTVEEHFFRFDRVLDSDADNFLVYEELIRPLVKHVSGTGEAATCFAFGQTGSGKSHTMFHEPSGVVFLAIAGLLEHCQVSKEALDVSFYEIYRGSHLYDLLSEERAKVMACEGPDLVQIVGLTARRVASIEGAKQVIQAGLAARKTGSTAANKISSRSHAVLQLSLVRHGHKRTLSFIDLAGSERGADRMTSVRDASSVSEQRSLEGAEINKSLLALKECIRAMDQGSPHIPFRQSKLTLVLKDVFMSKKSRTLMLATINPGLKSVEHTLNTLRYADRVRDLGHCSGEKERTVDATSPPRTAFQPSTGSASASASLVASTRERIRLTLSELKQFCETCTDDALLETMLAELDGICEATLTF